MAYIPRILAKELKQSVREYPVTAVLGPRQSGKTTLVQKAFPKRKYISLEDLDNRNFAKKDPRGFLSACSGGAIIDEAQRAPGLLSYIQTKADKDRKKGQFILTGSNQFLLEEKIAQSLAGRVALLRLLPLALSELSGRRGPGSLNQTLFKGFYPRLHGERIREIRWLGGYIETYISKDIRLIKNISNLSQFGLFLKSAAARAGQLLNLQSMANDCGISQNTAKAWLSVLESGFILKRLPPYHKNFRKRLVKAPKVYFYDTGILCRLLSVKAPEEIASHALKGAIFENMVFSEIEKHFFNQGDSPPVYFWRDQHGHEIDFLIEGGRTLTAIEAKAGQTLAGDFFKNIEYFKSAGGKIKPYLIYGGDESQTRHGVSVLPWRRLSRAFP